MRTNYKRGLCILSTAAVMIVASTLDAQAPKWRYRAVSGPDDQSCTDVATDGAGNSYLAGTFKNTAFFNTYVMPNSDGASGNIDGYLVKYARENIIGNAGTMIWAVKFGQTASVTGANERVSAIATYPNGLGGFDTYVVGSYSNTLQLVSFPTGGPSFSLPIGAAGSQSGFIAKYDNLGNVVWVRQIDTPGADTPNDVCVSPDGNGGVAIYVVGSSGTGTICPPVSVPVLSGSGGTDAFIIRFDGAGNAIWGRAMASGTDDAYYSVASATGGEVVITGQITGNGVISYNGASQSPIACVGTSDIVAVRYNTSGTLIYGLNGGGNTNTDAGLATAIDLFGNSYVAGYFSGTCTFNCTTGSFTKPNPGVGWEFFILKLDPTGNGAWMKSGGTPADGDAIRSIVVNNLANRIYVTGHFKGALSYEGVPTSLSSYSAANMDGFMLAAYANTGNLLPLGELQFGGNDFDDTGRAIAINAAEDVYIGSSISSTTSDMDWPASVFGFSFFTNTAGGSYETGLIRWDQSNWPALANDNECIHKGIGEWFDLTVWDWKISMGGSFTGTVSFPTAPISTTLTSTPSSSGPSSQDAYITTSNTFGDYLSFVNVMNGSGNEMVYDHLTDGVGNNYFTGYGPVVVGENFNFVGGASYPMTTGLSAGFLGKRSNTGGALWGVYFTPVPFTNSAVEAEGIAIDNSGNIYVTGGFLGRITFGTTSGSAVTLSSIAGDIFVAKYSNLGVLLWVKGFGSTGTEKGYSISVDNNGSYYVTGKFNTTGFLTFGPNNLGPTTSADIFAMKGDMAAGTALKGFHYASINGDIARDVISPNSSECYITGSLNNNTQCITGSIDFSLPTPSWIWVATNTPVAGAATVQGTDLIMGNNGYLYTSGYVTNPGTLTFGGLTESVNYHGFLVSYSSWLGTPTCLEVYDFVNIVSPPPPLPPRFTQTYAIALETGTNSPDHGDNVLVGGSHGHGTTVNISFAHKITTEGCVVSERRPDPVIPYAVSESALYGSLVYPNPLNGKATLEIRTDADFSSTPITVVITDMTGREVSRMSNITTKLVDINAENFSDGLYYYQVMQENKMISNGKMVVSH